MKTFGKCESMELKALWRPPFSLVPIISGFGRQTVYERGMYVDEEFSVWSSGRGFNKAYPTKKCFEKQNVVKYICGS